MMCESPAIALLICRPTRGRQLSRSETTHRDAAESQYKSFESILEQLQDTGPFLKAFRSGGSFGTAVDEKNEK